jgi:pyruvate/2-oxoglutarate dehydrogenase complex dihydrolipoamide acyltransferase (E2) component
MGRVTLTLPRLGETMEEARVTDWLVAPGAAFARGDVLLEVETDKTVVEVPALTAGTLIAQLVAAGDTVALDQPIAEVEVAGEGATAAPNLQQQDPPPTTPPAAAPGPAAGLPDSTPMPAVPVARPAASPAARAAARRAGVDLMLVQGTGRRGRVQGADVPRAGAGGATLVLLHGLFDSPAGWRDLPRRLRAAGHAVVTPDLPGHGAAPPAADFADAVDRMAAQMPQGPLSLIGHSLGSALAVRLALRLASRVERVVLSAPAGLGPRINADFIDAMLAAETTAALSRALTLLDAGPVSALALATELDRLRAERPGHEVLARAVARAGFQQIDIADDIARLGCPVSVMFGTSDRVLNWQDVANLPSGAAIHLVRGAGHLPHLAAPDLLVMLVTNSRDPVGRSVQA